MTEIAKPKPPRRATDPASPAMLELYKLLLASEKFINWRPQPTPEPKSGQEGQWRARKGNIETSCLMAEKHWTHAGTRGYVGPCQCKRQRYAIPLFTHSSSNTSECGNATLRLETLLCPRP